MLHPSTKKLVDRLAEMTELGKLSWTEGERGPIYSTEGYSVHLSLETGDLLITSKDGKELERASASDLGATPNDNGETYAATFETMARQATRIARGTEDAISNLLAGIEQETAEPVDEPVEAVELTSEPEDIADETDIASVAEFDTDEPEETVEAVSEEVEAATSEDSPEPAPIADEPAYEPVEEASLEEAHAPEATEEPVVEPDSTTDVSAAVARLAQEVNTRDETAEAAPAETPPPLAAVDAPAPAHQYVPFGLNGHDPESAHESDEGFVPISETGIEDTIEDDTSFGTEPDAPKFEPSNTPVYTDAAPTEPAALAPEAEAPQSFSLSGIGAGFGLGALKSTTEASGVPEATPVAEEDKVVIDATNDMPYTAPEPTPEEASALPDVADLEPMATEPAAEPAVTSEPEASEDAEDSATLKPRTRFNPWS